MVRHLMNMQQLMILSRRQREDFEVIYPRCVAQQERWNFCENEQL